MSLLVKQDSQSGMSDALAGDVSLNLGLVDPIDTDPDERPANGYGPKSVSPQRVCVKASETKKEGSLNFGENLKLNHTLYKHTNIIYFLFIILQWLFNWSGSSDIFTSNQ